MKENITPLRAIRCSKKLRLIDVARAVGIDTGNLSRIERGVQKPSLLLAESLSCFFDGSINELQILYPERFNTLNQQR